MWRACLPRRWPNSSIVPKPRCGPTSRTGAPSSAVTSKEGSGRHMKHPSQAALALQAGGDLGFISRWRVERHLAQCDQCREALEAYQVTRQILPDLAEIPEIPWNRLAAEMKANIRLGLEAGECVRLGDPPLRETRWFTGTRAAVAVASIVVLLVTGAVLERPAPVPMTAVVDEGIVVLDT